MISFRLLLILILINFNISATDRTKIFSDFKNKISEITPKSIEVFCIVQIAPYLSMAREKGNSKLEKELEKKLENYVSSYVNEFGEDKLIYSGAQIKLLKDQLLEQLNVFPGPNSAPMLYNKFFDTECM
jgi:hypothetical protein